MFFLILSTYSLHTFPLDASELMYVALYLVFVEEYLMHTSIVARVVAI